MSAENVEVVRAGYEAFTRGDLAGLGQLFAEDVEWDRPDSLPLGGVVRGRGAILENFAQIPQYWSRFSVEPDEYIDAGDHVVVRGVERGAGASGSYESRYLHLIRLSDGKIVRGEYISDTAKAKEALGR
jgi:ketosteroid isomerase-like protein